MNRFNRDFTSVFLLFVLGHIQIIVVIDTTQGTFLRFQHRSILIMTNVEVGRYIEDAANSHQDQQHQRNLLSTMRGKIHGRKEANVTIQELVQCARE